LNVVLIVIDTFGAEHAGGFMNVGATHTPHLDGLATEGVVFKQAYAPSPWTQPSVGSLFTAVMPSHHGLKRISDRMRSDLPTLAEILGRLGYTTGGVVSNLLLTKEFGFDTGFDWYDSSPVGGHEAITSDLVTDSAISWLEGRGSSRFFLYAHYFDPHYRYQHHQEFDQTSGYEGSLDAGLPIWDLRDQSSQLSRADIDYLIGLHREEIAYTDSQVGRLLTRLRELELTERTLVIVTSDHGEEFMRHGWIGHTRSLYQELLHVPMIISLPGRIAPGIADEPVSLVDVMPTILEVIGAAKPGKEWEGTSLAARLLSRGELSPQRPIRGEVSFFSDFGRDIEKTTYKVSLLSRRRKVIHDLVSNTWELYDLETDPEELHNLIGQGDAFEAQLVSQLKQWEATRADQGSKDRSMELDEDAIRNLRELGYL
jgi:arylsulfatase A-like enzyme